MPSHSRENRLHLLRCEISHQRASINAGCSSHNSLITSSIVLRSGGVSRDCIIYGEPPISGPCQQRCLRLTARIQVTEYSEVTSGSNRAMPRRERSASQVARIVVSPGTSASGSDLLVRGLTIAVNDDDVSTFTPSTHGSAFRVTQIGAQPERIGEVDRIPARVAVEVESSGEADGVFLGESPALRGSVPPGAASLPRCSA
jgi:hypothetical protein